MMGWISLLHYVFLYTFTSLYIFNKEFIDFGEKGAHNNLHRII